MRDIAEEAARQRALVDAKQVEIEKALIDMRLEHEDHMYNNINAHNGYYALFDMQISAFDQATVEWTDQFIEDAGDSVDNIRRDDEMVIDVLRSQVLDDIKELVLKLGHDGNDAEILDKINNLKESYSKAIEDAL